MCSRDAKGKGLHSPVEEAVSGVTPNWCGIPSEGVSHPGDIMRPPSRMFEEAPIPNLSSRPLDEKKEGVCLGPSGIVCIRVGKQHFEFIDVPVLKDHRGRRSDQPGGALGLTLWRHKDW